RRLAFRFWRVNTPPASAHSTMPASSPHLRRRSRIIWAVRATRRSSAARCTSSVRITFMAFRSASPRTSIPPVSAAPPTCRRAQFVFAARVKNRTRVPERGDFFRSLKPDSEGGVEPKSTQGFYDLARNEDPPFFSCVPSPPPHPPFHILPEYLERYDSAEINL